MQGNSGKIEPIPPSGQIVRFRATLTDS